MHILETTTKTKNTATATTTTAKITTLPWTYNLTLSRYMLSNRSVYPLVTTSNASCVCLLWKKLSYEDDDDDDDDDGDKDADENVMT